MKQDMEYKDEMTKDMCTYDLEENICRVVLYTQGIIWSDEQKWNISRSETIPKSCGRNSMKNNISTYCVAVAVGLVLALSLATLPKRWSTSGKKSSSGKRSSVSVMEASSRAERSPKTLSLFSRT